MTSFQSTPSQRGRLKSRNTARNTRAFQSTPSQRGRPLSWQKIFASKLFQSTPSQRGRQCEVKLVLTHQPFQSTPSQRGRPFQGWKPCRGEPISIHALAKRATCSAGAAPVRWSHFNPRPRKEGDCPIISFSTVPNLFQSTPSQRGRPVRQVKNIVYRRISIHALAKRATTPRRNMLTERKNFNPRPRKEGDFIFLLYVISSYSFQSTPSQRGRRSEYPYLWVQRAFQSTPSQRGRRVEAQRRLHAGVISIHALAKRATNDSEQRTGAGEYFNPRPRKEGDLARSSSPIPPQLISIHALAKRATTASMH